MIINPKANKEFKIKNFNPDEVGKVNGNLFGLPFSVEESEVIIIPAPWEATVSYRGGAASGPNAILNASPQLDLYDDMIPEAWKLGLAMTPISVELLEQNLITRRKAKACIEFLEHGGDPSEALKLFGLSVNQACVKLNKWVYETSKEWLNKKKIVGILGGDHSVPLGYMQALAEIYPAFGVLHIDAHADLRKGYQGFQYSHASIMYNALDLLQIKTIVQVGLRDFCKSEYDIIEHSNGRVVVFTDRKLKHRLFEGETWKNLCEEVIQLLPEAVYVSFDIDGLDPSLCPNTGTPVPGGLSYEEAIYLLRVLAKSGKKIIGFDLCEVAATNENDWDAMVGARVLYNLANLAAFSQGKFLTSEK